MWFLGIDIGTTHIKIIGIDEEGQPLAVKKCRTPVLQRDGLTFHDAQAVWQTVAALIIGLFPQRGSYLRPAGGDLHRQLRPGGVGGGQSLW
ncbi:Uncharacterised protein [Raoultella terrigena]|uniref:Carbohydrate kinase FGGY N-terminal domain-containing protein n=1 Tax=Raoultella terrigena TaxID=577 RepID=A0A4U9DAB0_RAOTE|nr:Uncharacterised protein [Raoultella terrigena]